LIFLAKLSLEPSENSKIFACGAGNRRILAFWHYKIFKIFACGAENGRSRICYQGPGTGPGFSKFPISTG